MITTERCVAIVVEDLGDWGEAELRSEFDPEGPVIRINARVVQRLHGESKRHFIEACIAHELYHYREAMGTIQRLRARADREAAACAHANGISAGRREVLRRH